MKITMILGTTDNKSTTVFFNMEISGLPASNSKAYAKLKATRDAFTGFLKFMAVYPVMSPFLILLLKLK